MFEEIADAIGMKGTYEERCVGRTDVKKRAISTAWVDDLKEYETAIVGRRRVVVVERYGKDREASEDGHDRWVQFLQSANEKDTVDELGLDYLPDTEEEGIPLEDI